MNFAQIFDTIGTRLEAIPIINKLGFRGKKLGIIASAAVLTVIVILILAIILCSGGGYKDVIKDYEKLGNYKITDMEDYLVLATGGFCKSEIKEIFSILENSEDFEDTIKNFKEGQEDALDNAKEEYGDNFKVKIEIDDKEELSKKELKTYRENIQNMGESLKSALEKFDDYKSDDWENLADELDISKSDAKDLIDCLKDLSKKLKNADVSDGYELECTTIISGSELDEPDEDDQDLTVIKIDGNWVAADMFTSLAGYTSLLNF